MTASLFVQGLINGLNQGAIYALIALGYTVVTVTRGQVMDAGAFNRLAHQLAKQTGKRLRYSDPDFTRKHRALRSELLQTFALKEDAR